MRSVEDLLAHQGALKFLFFWGHTPKVEGVNGPHVLSQWWPSPFELEGEKYATAEHFMMAEKARLFGDEERRREIMAAGHPNQAKSLGRLVEGYRDEVWEAERFDIVVRGNTAKFSSEPSLRDYLVGTGDRVLVEASPLDRIWGIGLSASDEAASDPGRWQGLNLLGFALMEARAALR
jgi:ribA/ribD-fused uncharacterized protein